MSIRVLLRGVYAACAVLCMSVAAPAHSASLNINGTNCTSWQMADNGGGNFTLTCITASSGARRPFGVRRVGLSTHGPRPVATQQRLYRCKAASDVTGHEPT